MFSDHKEIIFRVLLKKQQHTHNKISKHSGTLPTPISYCKLSQCNKARKTNKRHRSKKREIKPCLFTNDIISYIEICKKIPRTKNNLVSYTHILSDTHINPISIYKQ